MSPAPTQPSAGDHGRLPALDGLRGVAALVVVFHHALLASSLALAGIYRGHDVSGGVSGALVDTPLNLLWGGREAVFVFFVLSGFALALPHARGKRFDGLSYYPARFIRLYLPVWGVMAVSVALLAIVGREAVDGGTWWLNAHAEDLTLRRTVADASLFMAGSFMFFSAIWSLKWEIIFSAALPLYLLLGHSGRTIRILLVVASFIAIGSGTSDYLTYLPVFMLGTVLAYEHQHLNRALRGVAPATQACLLAGALLILAVTSWGGDLPAGLPDAIVALGALGVVALASASAGILPALLSRRPVHWLGTRSFSLYLVHEPLLVTLAFATGAGLAPVPFVLIGIPLALVGAEAFYRAIEHPSHRLARRVKSGTVGRRLALAD